MAVTTTTLPHFVGNGVPDPDAAGQFTRERADALNGVKTTPITEARMLQRLLFWRCCEEKVTDASLATLARSWCLVADTLRELKGVPKAGQFRPDLDPVQASKAMKRLRARMPIEVAGRLESITEEGEPETDDESPTAKPPAQ